MIFAQSWLFREKVLPLHTEKCGNSSVGRALASQAEGRGFEPRLPLNKPGHLVYGLRCEGRVGQVLLNPRADMTVIILTLVIIGYIFIATEAFTHINKAAVAVFVGVAAWLLYMLTGDSYVKAEHRDDFMMFVLGGGKSFNAYVAKNIFSKYITDACEVVLFLLATLGITEVLNGNGCFNFLSRVLRTRHPAKLIWFLVFTTFIISANLDNLSTTVMMLVVMHKLVNGTKLRMIYGSAIVIAASCGGALTVIGDVNGLTLWTKGFISPSAYSMVMALPTLLMVSVCTWLLSRMLPEHLPAREFEVRFMGDDSTLSTWQRCTLVFVGIGGLWFIPTFHNITALPPYVGALCVLSLLWVLNEIFNLRIMHSGKMIMKHSPVAMQYENIQTVLFYIGLTLMGGVCVETGAVDGFTQWICEKTGNPYVLSTIGGAVSMLLDSVAVIISSTQMAGSLENGNYIYESFAFNGAYWPLLNYACLVGGTLLTVGSLSGIMLMRMENVSLLWYLRRITPRVAVGGAVGAVALILITELL